MKNSEQGSIFTPLAYFWMFIIVIGTIGYVLWSEKQVKNSAAPPAEETTIVDSKKDINRDGKVDEFDSSLVRGQLNCTSEQPCWNDAVGKTMDGDNPIYTFDLDLNRDGEITDADLP